MEGKQTFSTNGAGTTSYPHENDEIEHFFPISHHIQKLIQNQIKDLNVGVENYKGLRKKTEA